MFSSRLELGGYIWVRYQIWVIHIHMMLKAVNEDLCKSEERLPRSDSCSVVKLEKKEVVGRATTMFRVN